METLDKNFTKATQWWQNQPNHASKQIQRVSVAMGLQPHKSNRRIPLPTSWLFVVAVALPRHPGREPRPAWFATGKRPESAKVSFPSSRRILLTLGQREMREAKQAGGTTQFVVTSNTSATHFEHCRDCTLVHTVAILTRRWQSHKAEPILENDGGLSHR